MKKIIPFVSVLALVGLLCLLPALGGGAEDRSEQLRFRGCDVLVVPQGNAEVVLLEDPFVEQFLGRTYLVGMYRLHPNSGRGGKLWVPIDKDTRLIECSGESGDYSAGHNWELVRQHRGEGSRN